MSLSARTGAALVLLLAAAASSGAYLGAAAARDLTEPGTRQLPLENPQSAAQTPAWAQRSRGGFTGFGGPPALAGVVLRSGTIAGSDDGGLTVDAPGVSTTVEYEQPSRLFRIRPAETPLAVGDTVLVRLVDGVASGVLRLLIEQ